MRQIILSSIWTLVLIGTSAATARAETITLVPKSFSELLSEDCSAIGPDVMKTEMNSGELHTEVYSRAYSGGGKYAYLYQVLNTGSSGNSLAEMFTLGEFAGAITSGDIGYLTGTLPAGFLNDGQTPDNKCRVNSLVRGLDVSFRYWDNPIAPTENSQVMYVVSDLSPGLVIGNVIDGNSATGPVVGAVPEPTTIVMSASGALAALAYSVIRRQRRK